MNLSFVMLSINCIYAFIEKRARKINFSYSLKPRSVSNFHALWIHFTETRGSELKVELGVIFHLQNRIITPLQTETVGHSPRFVGSLVSNNIVTIIADTFKYLCSYLSKLFITLKCDSISKVTRKTSFKILFGVFLTIINPHQVLPPNTLLLL